MKKILALFILLWVSWIGNSNAADNTVTLTVGSGVTMRTTDVGAGVQSSNVILSSTSGGGTAIYGTAGTANANVLSVQGIASGTALIITGSGTAGSGAAGVITVQGNASGTPIPVTAVGLAQGSTTAAQLGSLVMGAVTTSAPSYTTAQTSPISLTTAGDLRTVFSNTTLAVTNTGTFAVQAAQSTAANLNATVVGTGTFAVQAAATQSGTWTVQPGNTPNTTSWLVKTNDGTNTQLLDPCQSATKLYQTISQTTNTQLFAGTSAKKTYVCHIMVVGADAENISLVSGTGSVCATNTVAVIGATTAANGPNLSANGGFSIGMGGFSVAASTVNADNICLFQSGSGRVSGVMTYVAQ